MVMILRFVRRYITTIIVFQILLIIGVCAYAAFDVSSLYNRALLSSDIALKGATRVNQKSAVDAEATVTDIIRTKSYMKYYYDSYSHTVASKENAEYTSYLNFLESQNDDLKEAVRIIRESNSYGIPLIPLDLGLAYIQEKPTTLSSARMEKIHAIDIKGDSYLIQYDTDLKSAYKAFLQAQLLNTKGIMFDVERDKSGLPIIDVSDISIKKEVLNLEDAETKSYLGKRFKSTGHQKSSSNVVEAYNNKYIVVYHVEAKAKFYFTYTLRFWGHKLQGRIMNPTEVKSYSDYTVIS